MELLFAILVAFGAAFSTIFLMTYAQDRKNFRTQLGSMARPLIFLLLAIACWSASMPAFLAHDTVTTILPSYTITSNSPTGNTVFTIAASNVITNNNYPIPPATFYIYMGLWLMIMTINLIMLAILLLTWMTDAADDAIKGRD